MYRRFILHLSLAVGIGLCAGVWTIAEAQSTPTPPRQSTRLSPSDGGGLVVDFSKPKVEDTAPEAKTEPETVEAASATPSFDRGCSTGVLDIDTIVREAATRYGVDPCLVVAVMSVESGFRRYAVSPKGACGFMQLMPETARRFGVDDIFDARQNIHAGTIYLRFLLDRFGGNLDLTLAGYNAGEGAVDRFGRRIPPYLETQNYVRNVRSRYLNLHASRSSVADRGGQRAEAEKRADAPKAIGWRISVSFGETAAEKTAVEADSPTP